MNVSTRLTWLSTTDSGIIIVNMLINLGYAKGKTFLDQLRDL
jgi:hypothetical protein